MLGTIMMVYCGYRGKMFQTNHLIGRSQTPVLPLSIIFHYTVLETILDTIVAADVGGSGSGGCGAKAIIDHFICVKSVSLFNLRGF